MLWGSPAYLDFLEKHSFHKVMTCLWFMSYLSAPMSSHCTSPEYELLIHPNNINCNCETYLCMQQIYVLFLLCFPDPCSTYLHPYIYIYLFHVSFKCQPKSKCLTSSTYQESAYRYLEKHETFSFRYCRMVFLVWHCFVFHSSIHSLAQELHSWITI